MEEVEEGEKWVKHYSWNHQILLVGEGDFSFSLSLAQSFGSALNILASSLDPYDVENAKSNMENLEKLGASLLHGVDATKMKLHTDLKMQKFDRIVFNFPHAGFHGKEDNNRLINMHRKLVLGFFKNASGMLRSDGEIHVNHKTKVPFCLWNLEKLASQTFLVLIECVEFKIEDYPGYNNKRGDGSRCDEPFHLGECSTFKFRFSHAAKKSRVFSHACLAHGNSLKPREIPFKIYQQPTFLAENSRLIVDSYLMYGRSQQPQPTAVQMQEWHPLPAENLRVAFDSNVMHGHEIPQQPQLTAVQIQEWRPLPVENFRETFDSNVMHGHGIPQQSQPTAVQMQEWHPLPTDNFRVTFDSNVMHGRPQQSRQTAVQTQEWQPLPADNFRVTFDSNVMHGRPQQPQQTAVQMQEWWPLHAEKFGVVLDSNIMHGRPRQTQGLVVQTQEWRPLPEKFGVVLDTNIMHGRPPQDQGSAFQTQEWQPLPSEKCSVLSDPNLRHKRPHQPQETGIQMHELPPLFAEKSTDISHMYRRSPNKVQSFKSDRGKENMYGRCQQIPGIPFQMQQQQLPTSSSFTSQAHYVTTTSNNPMPERLPFSFGDRNESSRICDVHFYNARRSNYDKGYPFFKSSRHGFHRP